jgi:hypothetical protein
MRRSGKAWTVQDCYGNEVYLTWERWEHIINHHPSMEPFFDEVRLTVQRAKRWQDRWLPYKWFYVNWNVHGLEPGDNCIVVVVMFKPGPGWFVLTSYQDYWRER